MKKVLMTLTLAFVAFFSMITVDAAIKEEVNLKELKNDSMIIGNRIYDTNYLLSLYDIVAASSEYAAETGMQAPIYVYVVDSSNADNNFIIQYTGPVKEDGTVPMLIIEDVEEVYPDSKIDATAINNSPVYNFVEEFIEPEIAWSAERLNDEADYYGFHSIKYDAKTNTGTFTIDDLNRDLAGYQESAVISYFLTVAQYAESITYTIDGEEVTVLAKDLDTTKVIEIAYALLSDLAGDAKELTYGSVANRSTSAKVKFVYDGFEYNETFTLSFVYNAEEDKDIELEKYVEVLNIEAIQNGFSAITYDKDTNTGTFKIATLDAKLSDYQDSGIIGYFLAFIQGAESITYKLGGEDVTVLTKDLDTTKVIELAYALLADLAGDGKELTYGAVAEKSASATVVYNVNGEKKESTYTVAFEYIGAVKDQELADFANQLNASAESKGFESVVYDEETKTGTFTIKDLDAKLADYQDSGIVSYFLTFIQGAESITYTIGGEEITVLAKDLDTAKVIEIAYALLADLAGEAEELTYGAVAERTASAKVVYLSNGVTVETIYTVAFKYIETAKDNELDTYAKSLNDKADDGFYSVTYDKDTKTGTFVVEDDTKLLVDYKDSGIVGYFLTFIQDAYSITYTIDGEEITVLAKDLDTTKVVEIAYALLADMAGDVEELNYASVVGKEASAKVVYLSNGEEVEVTYTVAFERVN